MSPVGMLQPVSAFPRITYTGSLYRTADLLGLKRQCIAACQELDDLQFLRKERLIMSKLIYKMSGPFRKMPHFQQFRKLKRLSEAFSRVDLLRYLADLGERITLEANDCCLCPPLDAFLGLGSKLVECCHLLDRLLQISAYCAKLTRLILDLDHFVPDNLIILSMAASFHRQSHMMGIKIIEHGQVLSGMIDNLKSCQPSLRPTELPGSLDKLDSSLDYLAKTIAEIQCSISPKDTRKSALEWVGGIFDRNGLDAGNLVAQDVRRRLSVNATDLSFTSSVESSSRSHGAGWTHVTSEDVGLAVERQISGKGDSRETNFSRDLISLTGKDDPVCRAETHVIDLNQSDITAVKKLLNTVVGMRSLKDLKQFLAMLNQSLKNGVNHNQKTDLRLLRKSVRQETKLIIVERKSGELKSARKRFKCIKRRISERLMEM